MVVKWIFSQTNLRCFRESSICSILAHQTKLVRIQITNESITGMRWTWIQEKLHLFKPMMGRLQVYDSSHKEKKIHVKPYDNLASHFSPFLLLRVLRLQTSPLLCNISIKIMNCHSDCNRNPHCLLVIVPRKAAKCVVPL